MDNKIPANSGLNLEHRSCIAKDMFTYPPNSYHERYSASNASVLSWCSVKWRSLMSGLVISTIKLQRCGSSVFSHLKWYFFNSFRSFFFLVSRRIMKLYWRINIVRPFASPVSVQRPEYALQKARASSHSWTYCL